MENFSSVQKPVGNLRGSIHQDIPGIPRQKREVNMVDDFIHNLRSGKDKRFERGRRPYTNPQYKGQERQPNFDGRKPQNRRFIPDQMQSMINETIPAIKTLLETISENQKRLAEAEEMRASAENRKADALERIAVNLKQLVASGGSPSVVQTETALSEVRDDVLERPSAADREKVIQLIKEMREKGATYPQIAAHLEDQKTPTFSGKGKWHAQTVHKVCQQTD
jgi:hypothetical protein